MTDENLIEKKIDSEEIYNGHLLHVFKDTVLLPNGETAAREYLTHRGAVCVAALTDDGKLIVVRQFRYPFHKVLLELPAGKIDAGEEPLTSAKRELKEETGFSAKEWIPLGEYYPTVAYTDEIIYLYLAKGLTGGDLDLDEDEFLAVETADLKDLVEAVMNNEIMDGKSQTLILKTEKYLAK